MFDCIKYDIRHHCVGKYELLQKPLNKVTKFIFHFGLHATIVYRFGRWVDARFHSIQSVPLKAVLTVIYLISEFIIRWAYDISISCNADIGPGLRIGHFGGIAIGPCTIGSNCSVNRQVKILPDKISGRLPRIGSNVWIGAHARIEGSAIGDSATIASGAHVTKNVRCCNLVAGNPARVVLAFYDNSEIVASKIQHID